jgi:tRNA 2-thiouridine synthesizing protein E
LSEEHWDVINFLRDYFEEYQIAPAVRVLTKAIGKQFGKEKGNSKYLGVGAVGILRGAGVIQY